MARITTGPIVMIRAQVLETHPEIAEYKPFYTNLGFEGKLYVDIPVPASEVTKYPDGTLILTLDGWKAFLRAYTEKVHELVYEHQQGVQSGRKGY